MQSLPQKQQLIIAAVLALLMAVTRSQHFASIDHLPEASWAVFLLAGIYVRSIAVFTLLFGQAVVQDWAAITLGGVSSFCVSPAYIALLPGYGALWLAGRWYASRHREALSALLPYSLAALGGAVICELITSGSFYFFSGRFAETTLAGFAPRFARYFPHNLQAFVLYAASAAVIHAIVAGLAQRRQPLAGK